MLLIMPITVFNLEKSYKSHLYIFFTVLRGKKVVRHYIPSTVIKQGLIKHLFALRRGLKKTTNRDNET
jgi:hypothetical protein